jgi:hypothetical protein
MATTSNTYTGNGTNKLFSITFPYLETSDINVYLNGVLQTITTEYTFANATTVEFVTAPANGAVVLLDRSTDDQTLQATFFPGSSIKANDLNFNFDQVLYLSQETANIAQNQSTAGLQTQITAANNTSNTALTTANAATVTANSANTTATGIAGTANTALTNANAAVVTANTATSTANAATVTANSALSTVSGLSGVNLNRIINGDFQVWQRGVTFTNANGYTADRWTASGTGTLCNVGQGSHPSSLSERVALNFTGVAGNTRSFALQKIESQNMASLYPAPYAATQVTLSVNIYSTSARTIDLIADYANTADNFSAVTNITSHSVSVGANTFNRYSHTFTLPAEAARGMQIVLNAQTGITSGTVAFSMVQLEPGAVATPFEQRPIGTELSLCQRYYEPDITACGRSTLPIANGFLAYPCSYNVRKRTIPSLFAAGTLVTSNAYSELVGEITAHGFRYEFRNINANQDAYIYARVFIASAEL